MKNVLIVIALVVIGGCTAIEVLAPPVDNLFVAEAGLSTSKASQLQKGRNLYLKRCQKCHSLNQVDEITAQHWKEDMPEMFKKKAKLNAKEKKLIVAYIRAAAKINQKLIVLRSKAKK